MKLGFVSDIHEDIISLQKGLDVLYNERCEKIICLGDITGFSNPYYPFGNTKDANSCVNLVREKCEVVVPGNHDLFSAGKIPEFNAGIEYNDEWFRMDISERMRLMKDRIWFYEHEINPELTRDNIDYLKSLPEYHIVDIDGYNILVTHFLYPDISGSLRKRIDDIYDYRDHFWFMRQNSCILSFAGHMHKEGLEVVNRSGFHEFSFKKIKLKKTESIIGLPSVACGRNKNGVTVFDTDTFELKAVRLK